MRLFPRHALDSEALFLKRLFDIAGSVVLLVMLLLLFALIALAIKSKPEKMSTPSSVRLARWGIQTEESFRKGIQAILSDFTDLRVEHFTAYDEEGKVFGRPDQVKIDVLIRDGQTILGEIKSSMSKGDVYIFERKVAFCERRHGVKAERKIIITPMPDPRAQPVVDELGIQVYASAYDFGET